MMQPHIGKCAGLGMLFKYHMSSTIGTRNPQASGSDPVGSDPLSGVKSGVNYREYAMRG
jgi:hypothetical protein